MELEERGEVPRAIGEGKKAEFKTLLFGGGSNIVIPEDLPLKLKDPGSFSIPYMADRVKIDRALCDLGASVSLMPYPISRSLV